MKRAVQRELETGLAKALLRGEFGEDDTGTPLLPLHLPFLAMGLAVQQDVANGTCMGLSKLVIGFEGNTAAPHQP